MCVCEIFAYHEQHILLLNHYEQHQWPIRRILVINLQYANGLTARIVGAPFARMLLLNHFGMLMFRVLLYASSLSRVHSGYVLVRVQINQKLAVM